MRFDEDVVLIEHPTAKPPQCLAFALLTLDVIALSRDPSLEMLLSTYLKLSTLGAIKKDGWFRSVCVGCSLMWDCGLAKADDGQPTQFQCLREFVQHQP